jgi:hypothetical protein
LDRRCCRAARARPCSNGYLDRCATLDGNGVHSQRKAVRTHPLPLHWPLLSRDERASRCAWLWLRLRRHLRLGSIGKRNSARKQTPVVGNRACLGQILLRQNVQARLCPVNERAVKTGRRRVVLVSAGTVVVPGMVVIVVVVARHRHSYSTASKWEKRPLPTGLYS